MLIALLTRILAACSVGTPETGAPAAAQASGAGARIFAQNCVPCHREDGKGIPGVYPSLAQSLVANGDPRELVRWVLEGERPASMPNGRYSTRMPQFGWMNDPDAAAVLTYTRAHFGNSSTQIDAATVAVARP